jgi:hypothetical protein
MSKKNKFDFSHLVSDKFIKDGEKISFVSDSNFFGFVTKQPNGEYKVKFNNETTTLHAVATKLLGMEPPDHASKWFKAENGKTLYELWQLDIEVRKAA